MTRPPRRGEVWLVNLAPPVGHEQTGRRPAVVISEDAFNSGPADLVILLPITSTLRPIPSQVQLAPPDGGLHRESAVLCEAIRSVSRRRLVRRLGAVSAARLGLVEDALRILLRLESHEVGTVRGTMKGPMRLREDIKPVTALKTGAAKLLRSVNETGRPMVITQNGEPKGVLLDFDSYEDLRDATLLLKLIAQGEADVRARKTSSHEEVFAAARTRIRRR